MARIDRQQRTIEQLKVLRQMRERRAHDAMVRMHAAMNVAAGEASALEARIADARSAAYEADADALEGSVGKALSVADLSRLQSGFVAAEKDIDRLGEARQAANERADKMRVALVSARADHQARMKALRKVDAALDDLGRKSAARTAALAELGAEENGGDGASPSRRGGG